MTKFEVGKTYLHTLDTGAGMRFRIDARTEKMATVTIHPGGGRYEKTRRSAEGMQLKCMISPTAQKNGDTQECSWQQNTVKSLHQRLLRR